MDDRPVGDEPNQLEQLQYMQMIVEIRQKAFMQVLYGLLWWMGSAIAMYFALSSTGGTIYWYGGALGSLFHWHRAFKMISATQKAGAKALIRNEVILITVTAVLVVFSTMKIVPEYFRIDSPTIGTCWAQVDLGGYVPVACWSSQATVKSSFYSDSESGCGVGGYFELASTEAQFTCLEDL